MKIGFIGFGEAAFSLALGFSEAGVSNITAFDVNVHSECFGTLISGRAAKAKVFLKDSVQSVVNASDIVIAVIPPNHTLEVCEGAASFLRKGQLYVDVSASMPEAKVQMAEMVVQSGALFADVAMLGPLLSNKIRVPMAVSGSGAEVWCDFMARFNGDVENVGIVPGAASAIKLVRSIYMKGMAALMVEMLQAADYYHVTDKVVASIAKSIDDKPFESNLNRLVTGTALHAERRAYELTGSQALLREAGLDASMTNAAFIKHKYVAAYKLNEKYAGVKPDSYQTIIDDLKA